VLGSLAERPATVCQALTAICTVRRLFFVKCDRSALTRRSRTRLPKPPDPPQATLESGARMAPASAAPSPALAPADLRLGARPDPLMANGFVRVFRASRISCTRRFGFVVH
jgi:hypothetical protein